MNVILWVLGALAAGVIAEEFLGWVTPACRTVLRRGARRLPTPWCDRYAEEWEAELLALPEAAVTRILWTLRTRIGVHALRAELADRASGTQIPETSVSPTAPLIVWPAATGGPTVLRIAMGAQLRRLREARDLDVKSAALLLGAPSESLAHLELGRVALREVDLLGLLALYGVTDAEDVGAYLELAQQADVPGWWHRYADLLPTRVPMCLALEESAALIRAYGNQLIPDLLQTPDYAVHALASRHRRADLKLHMELLMRRQQLLDGSDAPPKVWAVIDEAALRRPVGSVPVQLAQLQYLLDVSERPEVTIQILPLHVAGTYGSNRSFTILQLPPGLPNIVYVEQLTSAIYLDQPDDLELYQSDMDVIALHALPPARTRAMLAAIRSDFES
ncbi:helix-turn-helix transcriptional regulator [Kribbella sp. NPDC050459]|uniref:helix-turn-helix domain-containing protein n=1 Tax=Kribbella sp. NPDC050459 TaxID=3155785 RepID=UPI0033DB1455